MSSQDEVKGDGFEIIDHKAPPAEASEEATEPAAEAQGQPVSVDVYTLLRISIAQLASIAWQMMGLQPDPFTNQVRTDTDQARIAIDAAAALVDQLKPHLGGQEARDYQTLLTDLRLNFVSHSGERSDEQSETSAQQ
jgi:hypothetical protein